MNGYVRGLEAVTARRQRARREAAGLVHRGLDVTSFARAASSSVAHAVPCEGDLVCHLVIDAQDVLITLVTPAETEPTCGAVIYWDVAETPPTGDDPLDALTVRLAAYEEPRLLKFHFDDVGCAADRAAELVDGLGPPPACGAP